MSITPKNGYRFNFPVRQMRRDHTEFTTTIQAEVVNNHGAFILCKPLSEAFDFKTLESVISLQDKINISPNHFNY